MVRAAIVAVLALALGGTAWADKPCAASASVKKGEPVTFATNASAAALLQKRGRDTILTQWTGRYLVAMGRYIPFDAVVYDACTSTWSSVPAWSGESKVSQTTLHRTRIDGARVLVTTLDGVPVVALDPATLAWTSAANAPRDKLPSAWDRTRGAPAKRQFHVEIVDGDRTLIWGGHDDKDVRADGAIYSSATRTWTPIATTGAPRARAQPGAVLAAGRLVVWGGWSKTGAAPNQIDCLGDGAIYDPAKKKWTAIAAKDAPAARHNAITIVDGDRVYVFGGSPGCPQNMGGKPLADGAMLDTKTATWTPITLPDGVNPDPMYPPRPSAYVLPDRRVIVRGRGKMWIYDPAAKAIAPLPAATDGTWIAIGFAGGRLVGWGKIVVVGKGGGCDGPRPPNMGCDPVAAPVAYMDQGWMIQL